MSSAPDHPEQVGPYRILQPLGEGGMGVVYEAEQREPVRRRVALKLVKLGMDTREVVARFETERQALAMMDHPGIARVFDAGVTPEGGPYFVMELVRGVSLLDYCDTHRLPVRDRIRLFVPVCHAVQHAHQKGVIHRDLKPSNILVAEHDGRPTPRIIDFGIAKATGARLTESTVVTTLGQAMGTAAYMSPEQAEMSGLDVDTRTDVYSLGVVLYQLLVGWLPVDPATVGHQAFLARLAMRETDPPTPSTRFSTGQGDRDRVARFRGTDPSALHRELRGDLDWIVMKAMDPDRSRRYDNVNDLARDLERYLNDEPVLARPPSARYRARKFLRRHKVGAGIAATALVGLVGFAAAMGWQARRISVERQRAEWVSSFLLGLFLAPDPDQARGRTVTAKDLLDRGARQIETELEDDPVLQGRVMTMLGRTYEGLGDYDDAARILERAMVILREALGPYDPATLAALHNLALVTWDLGRYQEAETLYREAVEAGTRGLGETDPLTLVSMGNLANALFSMGRYAEAETLTVRVLETRRRVRGPDHPETLAAAADLAATWHRLGRLEESEGLFRQTVADMERVLGKDSPQTFKGWYNLALLLNQMRRYAEADTFYAKALQGMRTVLGEDHPNTLTGTVGAAMNLANQRRFSEAEPMLRETLDAQRRVLGPSHPSTLNTVYNLGCLAALEGDRSEALAWLRQAVRDGYADAEWMAQDSDLESLHGDPQFEEIVAGLRQAADAGRG
ncbi:MAG TPA: serine/threonine-protein kinase [Longimicrobiales bacterium]|nr:serine/threonine-protein kinase [Longimicrobiales bacterium]